MKVLDFSKIGATLGILAFLAVLVGSSVMAAATTPPIIDGKFDQTVDHYTQGYALTFHVEDGPTLPNAGRLWTHEDAATGNVSLAFIQPVSLVDNTYGANSIGWGADAPTGKHHSFKDLLNSDKAEFVFKDSGGSPLLDVTIDYLKKVGSVYKSVVEKADVGSTSAVLATASSLEHNLGLYLSGDPNLALDNGDSPFIDNRGDLTLPDYTSPVAPVASAAPDWIFEVVYELQVDGATFFPDGFGSVHLEVVHDSPNKLGKNKVWDDMQPLGGASVPEPSSLALFGVAGICAFLHRRRKQRKQSA